MFSFRETKIYNRVVPLEPTIQPILRFYGQLQKSGTKIHKNGQEKSGSVSPPQQDMIHPGFSGSRGQLDLGLGYFLQD